MTRPVVKSGRPNTEVFPEQAKQIGRAFGLTGQATIYRYQSGLDSGGAPNDSWVPDSSPVPAQLQPLRTRGAGETIGSQIDEASTHIVSFDHDSTVTSNDRFLMDGTMWEIRSRMVRDNGAQLVDRFTTRQV